MTVAVDEVTRPPTKRWWSLIAPLGGGRARRRSRSMSSSTGRMTSLLLVGWSAPRATGCGGSGLVVAALVVVAIAVNRCRCRRTRVEPGPFGAGHRGGQPRRQRSQRPVVLRWGPRPCGRRRPVRPRLALAASRRPCRRTFADMLARTEVCEVDGPGPRSAARGGGGAGRGSCAIRACRDAGLRAGVYRHQQSLNAARSDRRAGTEAGLGRDRSTATTAHAGQPGDGRLPSGVPTQRDAVKENWPRRQRLLGEQQFGGVIDDGHSDHAHCCCRASDCAKQPTIPGLKVGDGGNQTRTGCWPHPNPCATGGFRTSRTRQAGTACRTSQTQRRWDDEPAPQSG